jgi:hypothetical protein
MRLLPTCIFAIALFPFAAFPSDAGVTPRASASDYPVQGRADSATIAAAIIPPNQVSKMFSSDIAKQYIVVEVAIYPEGGVPFEVRPSDFALRVGQRTIRPDKPVDVAPWPEKRDNVGRLPVDVTAEVGIAHESDNDPIYGRRSSTGTYTGVAVSSPRNDIPPPPQPPDPRVDPRIIADKAQRLALAEGDTKVAVAGYLYFPQFNKRKKSDQIELKYAKDDVSVNLILPK